MKFFLSYSLSNKQSYASFVLYYRYTMFTLWIFKKFKKILILADILKYHCANFAGSFQLHQFSNRKCLILLTHLFFLFLIARVRLIMLLYDCCCTLLFRGIVMWRLTCWNSFSIVWICSCTFQTSFLIFKRAV